MIVRRSFTFTHSSSIITAALKKTHKNISLLKVLFCKFIELKYMKLKYMFCFKIYILQYILFLICHLIWCNLNIFIPSKQNLPTRIKHNLQYKSYVLINNTLDIYSPVVTHWDTLQHDAFTAHCCCNSLQPGEADLWLWLLSKLHLMKTVDHSAAKETGFL